MNNHQWEIKFAHIAEEIIKNTKSRAGIFIEENNVMVNDYTSERELEIMFTYPDINGNVSVYVHPSQHLLSWEAGDVVKELAYWFQNNASKILKGDNHE